MTKAGVPNKIIRSISAAAESLFNPNATNKKRTRYSAFFHSENKVNLRRSWGKTQLESRVTSLRKFTEM